VALVSGFVAYVSFQQNKKNQIIAQTPLLIPTFRKSGEQYTCHIENSHKSALAKEVCVVMKGAKLKSIYSKENEFLVPGMSIYPIEIKENIDGATFEIKYKNIFDKNIELKGTVHEMALMSFDLQNISFKIESIN